MAIPYRVVRFFQPKYSLGAVGVIFNDAGEVLLVEHAFHPQTPWGLPGGWVSRNEHPADTVQREIREELSLDVSIRELVLVDVPYPNHLDVAFLCDATGEIGALSYELLSHQWVAPDQMPLILSFHYHAIQQALSLKERLNGK